MLGNRSKKCPFYTDISGTISSIISLFRKLFFCSSATELTFVLLYIAVFIYVIVDRILQLGYMVLLGLFR